MLGILGRSAKSQLCYMVALYNICLVSQSWSLMAKWLRWRSLRDMKRTVHDHGFEPQLGQPWDTKYFWLNCTCKNQNDPIRTEGRVVFNRNLEFLEFLKFQVELWNSDIVTGWHHIPRFVGKIQNDPITIKGVVAFWINLEFEEFLYSRQSCEISVKIGGWEGYKAALYA